MTSSLDNNQISTSSPSSIGTSNTTSLNTKHWSQKVHESTLIVTNLDLIEDTLLTKLNGGSDNGQFIYLDASLNTNLFKYYNNSGRLEPYEIILEIEKQKVSGYTLFDVISLIKQLCKLSQTITIRTVTSALAAAASPKSAAATSGMYLLPIDLRQYLDERFQKASIDYDLQQVIRENVYMRTVPCTTRSPRNGEVNGQDYIFLSNEDFLELENNGDLLEYGIYNGHYYGTPKPPKQPFINFNFSTQLAQTKEQVGLGNNSTNNLSLPIDSRNKQGKILNISTLFNMNFLDQKGKNSEINIFSSQ
jgi:hypothetical protein